MTASSPRPDKAAVPARRPASVSDVRGVSAANAVPVRRPVSGGFYVALADLGAEMGEPDRLRRRAMAHLRSIATLMEASAEAMARRHGVHVTDLYVLMILFHANERHIGKLAVIQSALGFTAGGMTRRMDSMVRKGLAERHPDPDDRRAWLAQLTEKGAIIAADVQGRSRTRSSLAGKDLSGDEWRLLGDLLARIDRAAR